MSTTTLDKDTAEVLNDLLATTLDGQYGFAKCAERVKSSQLREILQRRSDDCQRAAGELRGEVAHHGGTAVEGGSTLGAVHRGWMAVKEALTPDSDRSVLDEAERGEDHALAAYRKALKAELPQHVRDLLTRQMTGTQASHDQIKALRDSTTT